MGGGVLSHQVLTERVGRLIRLKYSPLNNLMPYMVLPYMILSQYSNMNTIFKEEEEEERHDSHI